MRKLIEGRPLLLCAVGVLGGAVTRSELWFLSALVIVVILVSDTARKLVFVAGCVLGWATGNQSAPQVVSRTPIDLEAIVSTVPTEYGDQRAATVAVGNERYRMSWSAQELSVGDTVRVRGELRPLRESTLRMATLDGVSGRIAADQVVILKRGPELWRWGLNWRKSFRELTHSTLPEKEASMVLGICFNMDQDLSDELRLDLQRTGTIHILSASGLHIAVFATFLHSVLGFAPIPRLGRIAAVLGLLVVYAAGAGLEPPIVRSVVMAAILLSAYAFRRQADALSALAAAFLVEFLRQPGSIGDIGVQLSYVTTLGILLFPPRLEFGRPMSPFAALKAAAHVSFVAWIASMPLVAYHFGIVSLTSVPMNLVVGIFATPILAVGLGASVLSPIFPAFSSSILMPFAGFLASNLAEAVHWAAQLPVASLELPGFHWAFGALLYAFLILLWRRNELVS